MTAQLDTHTPVDGVDFINIGTTAQTPLGMYLGYYNVYPRRLQDGRRFYMWAGLYYYWITSGDNTRFLRAKTLEDLEAKAYYQWENVVGLSTQLESALTYNLRNSTLAVPLIRKLDLPIDWVEPGRELTNAEKRWLRVVQNTVRRLQSEFR